MTRVAAALLLLPSSLAASRTLLAEQPYSEQAAVPAHQVYPISVSLTLKLEQRDTLCERLVRDTQSSFYRDTVWPSALEFYRPLVFEQGGAAEHYKQRALGLQPGNEQSELDPFFPDIGLFGRFRNGLSVLMLALATMPDKKTTGKIPRVKGPIRQSRSTASTAAASASAASSSAAAAAMDEQADEEDTSMSTSAGEVARKILCSYIACVALHFWLLINKRWVELDPQQLHKLKEYMPPYLFDFHPSTDFTDAQRTEVAKERAAAAKKKRQ